MWMFCIFIICLVRLHTHTHIAFKGLAIDRIGNILPDRAHISKDKIGNEIYSTTTVIHWLLFDNISTKIKMLYRWHNGYPQTLHSTSNTLAHSTHANPIECVLPACCLQLEFLTTRRVLLFLSHFSVSLVVSSLLLVFGATGWVGLAGLLAGYKHFGWYIKSCLNKFKWFFFFYSLAIYLCFIYWYKSIHAALCSNVYFVKRKGNTNLYNNNASRAAAPRKVVSAPFVCMDVCCVCAFLASNLSSEWWNLCVFRGVRINL